jgi:hypothetical protein
MLRVYASWPVRAWHEWLACGAFRVEAQFRDEIHAVSRVGGLGASVAEDTSRS